MLAHTLQMYGELSPTARELGVQPEQLNLSLPQGVMRYPRSLRGLRVVGTPNSHVLREVAMQCPALEEVCVPNRSRISFTLHALPPSLVSASHTKPSSDMFDDGRTYSLHSQLV